MIDGLLLGVGCVPAESTSVPLAEHDHNAPSATFSLPSRLSLSIAMCSSGVASAVGIERLSVPVAVRCGDLSNIKLWCVLGRKRVLLGRGLESSARKRRSFAAASPD